MSDWTGQDYINELSRRPGASAPASLGEIWRAEWAGAGLDTISGVGQPHRDAMDELRQAIEKASGKSLSDFAYDHGMNLGPDLTDEQRQVAMADLVHKLPEDQQKAITPLLDVRRRAAEKAQGIEKAASDVSAATYGLSGTATAFLAGLARQAVDPFNAGAMIATAPLGGEGGAVSATIAREAFAAGTAQAGVEPFIQTGRAQLGLEHGFGRAVGDVVGAAAGGGLIAGGAMGLAALFRRAAKLRARPETPKPSEAPAAAPTQDWNGEQTFTGYMGHDDGAWILDQTRPPPEHVTSVADVYGGHISDNFDFAQAATAQPTRVRSDRPYLDYGTGPQTPTGYLDHGTADWLGALHEPRRPPPVDNSGAAFSGDGFSGFDISSADFEAAARAMDREHLVDLHAPGEDFAAQEAHQARVESAAHAIEVRQPIEPTAEDIQTRHMQATRRPQVRYRPQSLVEFLAATGGISSDDKQIADLLQSFGGKNPFVPGFGRLVRKGGRPLDQAREAAVEAGFLSDAGRHSGDVSQSTVNDLLGAVDTEARGDRVYPAGHEHTKTKSEIAGQREADRAAREQFRAEAAANFDEHMAELKIEPMKGARKRALQMMEREGITDPLVAYERALIEHEDKQDAIRAARTAEQSLYVPGWDVPDEPAAAPAMGGEAARAKADAGSGATGQPARAHSNSDRGAGGQPTNVSPAPVKPAGADVPAAVDAIRAIDERGGDFEITLPDENGNPRQVSAKAALREADEDAQAAAEFKDCLGGGE